MNTVSTGVPNGQESALPIMIKTTPDAAGRPQQMDIDDHDDDQTWEDPDYVHENGNDMVVPVAVTQATKKGK